MTNPRFMFVGDIHVADTSPSRRDEHYRKDILNKLREIMQLANKSKCDAVLFAGDIFHHKQPRMVSHRLVLDLIEIFESFDMQVFILVGNHDITEGRLESLEKQPLGVLGHLSNVTLLQGPVTQPELFRNVAFYSIPGVPGITEADYSFPTTVTGKWNVLLAHQSIVPDKSKLPEVLRSKDFMHDSGKIAGLNRCNLVLYGHEHARHGVYKRGDTTFVNLGSICRGTISESDLSKVPAVFIFELGDKIAGKEVKLKSVRPIEECYLLEEHFEAVERNKDIEEAISRLKDTRLQRFSVETVVMDVTTRDDIEEDVRKSALGLLETVR